MMKKLIITIMLMLGFGTVSLSANENTPEDVILGFAKAIQNNDMEKAKTYVDRKSFIVPKNIRKPNLGNKDILNRKLEGLYSLLVSYNTLNPKDWSFKVEKDTNGIDNYDLLLINPKIEQRWTSFISGIEYRYNIGVRLIKVNDIWKIASIID